MTLTTSQNSGLHVRYEKAGLVFDALPIPWNADAVIVEATLRIPAKAPRAKHDFTLRLEDNAAHLAELISQQGKQAAVRVFFRIPAPATTCIAEIHWREHALGKVELPVLTQAGFEAGIALEMATVYVMLGGRMVACRSFVSAQAKGAFASAILRSPTPLAPALQHDLRVEVQRESGEPVASVPVPLVADQLRARQTLLTAALPKLRWQTAYRVSWFFGPRSLHAQSLRVVSKKAFQRSLRISATRFIVERDSGAIETVRSLPIRGGEVLLDGIRAVVPCFYVSSGPGMAGLAPFTLRAMVGDLITTLGTVNDVLVTDGPTPVVLGAVPAADLGRLKHFTLAVEETALGNLPLVPAPQAEINAEGGFAPLDDFLWSPAAEEQLNERLGKLLGGT